MNSSTENNIDNLDNNKIEKFYFNSQDAMNSAFAGNIVKNLQRIEAQFGVKISSRHLWIGIHADNETIITEVKRFFESLVESCVMRNGVLDQADFEYVLSSFRNRRDEQIKELFSFKVPVSPRKRDLVPRTKAQLEYLEAIQSNDIVFGIGPAGTGKTYLAMAMAVSELLKGNYTRIILTRPAKEAGENLGFLPGNLEEKIMPYLRPLYDALYDMLTFEEAQALIEKNVIEVAPLAFMRGRTLNNAFIILDEAQNTTEEQMLMFLTRLGFDSQCVVTGDPSQTDLPRNCRSGLLHAKRVLNNIDDIKFCSFKSTDVVRHSLVERIVNAYEMFNKYRLDDIKEIKSQQNKEENAKNNND
ncbi:PhoH family protein [Lentisphaerota bacterium WC36G]|nr:PhoH family protein [Lentisphaerae bacterium WC36]